MIAMAILAAALLPLLALQGQFVRTVDSFERADARIDNRSNALAYLKTVNLTRYPRGQQSWDGIVLTWESVPAGPPQMSRPMVGGEGRFEITLYDVTAVLELPTGGTDSFAIRGLGWKAIGPLLQ